MQRADVKKTHGNNSMIKKLLEIKQFENINLSIKKTVDWFREYYT